MALVIRESNGTFKVTVTSLAGYELAVYREGSGGFTFELREADEVEHVPAVAVDGVREMEVEHVPEVQAVAVEEVGAVVVQDEAVPEVRAGDVRAIVTPDDIAYVQEYTRSNTMFHKLSDLRRKLAAEAKMPPYIIFHDTALLGMAEQMPADLTALGKIKGVGKIKLEKYGAMFLSVLHGEETI